MNHPNGNHELRLIYMENVFGIIYKITNKINGKVYIGKTKRDTHKRWMGHLRMVRHQLELDNPTILLSKAINKYGASEFTIEEIDKAYSKEELNQKEKDWIIKYDSRNPEKGYNLAAGGDGGIGGPMFKGHHHSQETKDKYFSNRAGENNSNYGNRWHHTPDMNYPDLHGENNPMYGKHHSEETRQFYKDRFSNTKAFSNKDTDDVVMVKDDDLEEIQRLLDNGYIKGNWHITKEYRNRNK